MRSRVDTDGDYVRRRLGIDSLDREGCWNWLGSLSRDGRAVAHRHGYHYSAPRLVYELLVGPVPRWHVLRSACGNTRCVRPEHREVLLDREAALVGNTITAINTRKTACPRGHAYSQDPRTAKRICRTCRRDRMRDRRGAARALATCLGCGLPVPMTERRTSLATSCSPTG